MNVLITGFDPFGGEPINPAWEAVKAMKDEIAGATITKLQIPTVVAKSIAKVHEKMQELRPDIVISIGQAGGRFRSEIQYIRSASDYSASASGGT